MEIVDLHTQLEELAVEMQKLGAAAALVDRSARGSEAVVAQGEELLGATTKLVEQAGGAVARAAEELGAEAAALRSLKADVDVALAKLGEQAREHAEQTEASVKEVLEQQLSVQSEVAGHLQRTVEATASKSKERGEQVHKEVQQLAEAQRGLAAELKSGLAAAAQNRAELADNMQGALTMVITEGRQELYQALTKQIDRTEAKLVEQVRANGDALRTHREEVEGLSQRTLWGFGALAVLQVIVLLIVL